MSQFTYNDYLAVKVMGYEVGLCDRYNTREYTDGKRVVQWAPESDLHDAVRALEMLREKRDWWWELHGRTCPMIVITGGDDKPIVPAIFITDDVGLAMGICRYIKLCLEKAP